MLCKPAGFHVHRAKMLSEAIFRASFKEGGIQCEFIFKMSPEMVVAWKKKVNVGADLS